MNAKRGGRVLPSGVKDTKRKPVPRPQRQGAPKSTQKPCKPHIMSETQPPTATDQAPEEEDKTPTVSASSKPFVLAHAAMNRRMKYAYQQIAEYESRRVAEDEVLQGCFKEDPPPRRLSSSYKQGLKSGDPLRVMPSKASTALVHRTVQTHMMSMITGAQATMVRRGHKTLFGEHFFDTDGEATETKTREAATRNAVLAEMPWVTNEEQRKAMDAQLLPFQTVRRAIKHHITKTRVTKDAVETLRWLVLASVVAIAKTTVTLWSGLATKSIPAEPLRMTLETYCAGPPHIRPCSAADAARPSKRSRRR